MIVDALVPILNVSDLQRSFTWFEKLGFEKRWDYGDPPDFGAVGIGAFEIFLCLDGQGSRASDGGEGGAWMSVFLESPAAVDELHERARDRRLAITHPPTDMPWNVRECHIRHPDGHTFRFGATIEFDAPAAIRDAGPPLEIERVDVPVRLERRLAGLLADLAAHKGMSISSCLEETLLHTFERVSGGVASPHLTATFGVIRELKRKHGIEYDTHASYRFVERP